MQRLTNYTFARSVKDVANTTNPLTQLWKYSPPPRYSTIGNSGGCLYTTWSQHVFKSLPAVTTPQNVIAKTIKPLSWHTASQNCGSTRVRFRKSIEWTAKFGTHSFATGAGLGILTTTDEGPTPSSTASAQMTTSMATSTTTPITSTASTTTSPSSIKSKMATTSTTTSIASAARTVTAQPAAIAADALHKTQDAMHKTQLKMGLAVSQVQCLDASKMFICWLVFGSCITYYAQDYNPTEEQRVRFILPRQHIQGKSGKKWPHFATQAESHEAYWSGDLWWQHHACVLSFAYLFLFIVCCPSGIDANASSAYVLPFKYLWRGPIKFTVIYPLYYCIVCPLYYILGVPLYLLAWLLWMILKIPCKMLWALLKTPCKGLWAIIRFVLTALWGIVKLPFTVIKHFLAKIVGLFYQAVVVPFHSLFIIPAKGIYWAICKIGTAMRRTADFLQWFVLLPFRPFQSAFAILFSYLPIVTLGICAWFSYKYVYPVLADPAARKKVFNEVECAFKDPKQYVSKMWSQIFGNKHWHHQQKVWSVIGESELAEKIANHTWRDQREFRDVWTSKVIPGDPMHTFVERLWRDSNTNTRKQSLELLRVEVLSIPIAAKHFLTTIQRYSECYAENSYVRDFDIQRGKVYDAGMEKLRSSYVRSNSEALDEKDLDLPIVLSWHGTSTSLVHRVAKDGLLPLRTTDGGYFAAGSYTALEAWYAGKYAKADDNGVFALLLLATFIGTPYVITPEMDYDAYNYKGKAKFTFNGEMGIACDDDGFVQEVIEQKVIVQKVIGNDGIVKEVRSPMPLKVGDQIVSVGGYKFSQSALKQVETNGSDYKVIFYELVLFSNFYNYHPDEAIAIKSGHDTHFVPVKFIDEKYDFQACPASEADAHEVVSREFAQCCPIAVCYFKKDFMKEEKKEEERESGGES